MLTNQAQRIRAIRDKAQGIKVLYVEDDPLIRQEYLTFLSRFFEQIESRPNGEEGLQAALEEPFDLIITDVQMPKLNGLEMIERIKERRPDQFTLLVSAYKDIDYLHRSVQLGVDGYLFKPIERGQTIDTLYKIVSQIRMARDNARYQRHLEELVEIKTREALESYTVDRISGLSTLAKLEQDIRTHPESSLALLKICDFKTLNDTYGYETGNAVLQQTAHVLRTLVINTGVECHGLYRTSGAHFAFLAPIGIDRLEPLVEQLIQAFESTEITVADHRMFLEMNAAIVSPNDELSLSHADFALRQAEKEGCIVIYRPDEHRNHERTLRLKRIDTIKRALQEGRFVPYYQPIVDNATLRVTKYEALARLVTNTGEVHSPGYFLDIAKATKMYGEITRMIVKTVLRDFRESEASVSLNLSIEDIAHLPTRAFLFEQISAFPEPGRLVFELLESEGIESYGEIQEFFVRLKELGCRVALDDFGSGYSNFEHLAKLDVDYIKIDGSLIHAMQNDDVSLSIVEMLSTFARRMGIKTIAEFVSDDALQQHVHALGISESQGYLFGQPAPFGESMRTVCDVDLAALR